MSPFFSKIALADAHVIIIHADNHQPPLMSRQRQRHRPPPLPLPQQLLLQLRRQLRQRQLRPVPRVKLYWF